MKKQTQLILQETFESCMMAMEDFIGHASDLESIGQICDADDLRQLAGQIEDFIASLRRKHN